MCKQLRCAVTLVALLALGGAVQAATVTWIGMGPDQLWSTPANWNPAAPPTSADTARIEIKDKNGRSPVIAGEDVVVTTIEMGWSTNPDELTIDSGTLTTVKGITVGRKNVASTLNMNGGTLTTGTNLTMGYWSEGILVVNGGSIRVGGKLEVSVKPAIPGFADLRGGIVSVKSLSVNPDPCSVGSMDMGGGTLIVDGNSVPYIQGCIDKGWITAFNGRGGGTLQLDYDTTRDGKTTLTSVHSLQPNPAYYSSVGTNVRQLQWVLPEPNQPGGVVTCDVYFGADPDIEADPKVVVRGAAESVSVSLDPDTVYYWALDIYDSSVSNTEPAVLSPIFTFDTKNTPPVVEAGDGLVTWLVNGSRVANLDASVTDNGLCTVHWTVVSEPDDPNHPDAIIANPNVKDTTVTMAAAGKYVLQIEAFDGEFTVADTVTIDVYNDGCGAAQSLPDYVPLLGDLNGDCKVDDADMTLLQENWLKDNSLTEEWFLVD